MFRLIGFVAQLSYSCYCNHQNSNKRMIDLIAEMLSPTGGSLKDAQELLQGLQLTGIAFSQKYPATPLHWMVADRTQCFVIETLENGLQVYDNLVGVLTNTSPFDDQMFQLCNYMHLSPRPPHNLFSQTVHLKPYSRGMGAIGLPGDSSSQSRFARAAFIKLNSICSEHESLSQFFIPFPPEHPPRLDACRPGVFMYKTEMIWSVFPCFVIFPKAKNESECL
ncbi:MAG: linear amide C-N hydrolase [Clostridia bacterium]|nr:linear amide C-N hydrolase [Clostridia bacterium]